MTEFELKVAATVEKYNMLDSGDTVIAGVSGGADSVAMLYALCAIRERYRLNIICVHLNHGIRGIEALRDEQYVASLCSRLGIECKICHKDIPVIAASTRQSEELAGRTERYRLFQSVAADAGGGKVAVAHNKNDSVETVLMKLVRGCSLNGLRGIAPVNGNIIRPLIECDRASIESYLESIGAEYMTDSTNTDNRYTRNSIRNSVMPLLQQINPGLINTVYSNSRSLADDDDYLEQCCAEHCGQCVVHTGDRAEIDLKYYNSLHISMKKRIILYVVSLINGSKADIEQKHIDMLTGTLPTGKKYDLSAGIKAYTEYDRLIICREFVQTPDYEYDVIFGKEYHICDKCIFFEISDNNDMSDGRCMYINADCLEGKKITLRNRRDGDKFAPSGMSGTKKLKSFFIDSKISQSERNTTPLLCIDGEIAAVLGYRVSSKFVVTDKTNKTLKAYINGGTNE